MSFVENCKIIENRKLNECDYLLKVFSKNIADSAMPGQFVNIKCGDGNDAYLRRPISICSCDKSKSTVDIVYQVKGIGTKILSEYKPDEFVNILGPLGNGFRLFSNYKKIAVIGGGIGTFPLLYTLENKGDRIAHTYLGFRNKDAIVLEQEFKNVSDKIFIMTDDGSNGNKGFAITPFIENMSENYDCVYVCGPAAMIDGVAKTCLHNKIECQVSLEQRMGCGIGACLVCACKTNADNEFGWEHLHVCKNGPVFNAKQLYLK